MHFIKKPNKTTFLYDSKEHFTYRLFTYFLWDLKNNA